MNTPNSQVTEQARELLAREYEREGRASVAEAIRAGEHDEFDNMAFRAIEAALTARTEAPLVEGKFGWVDPAKRDNESLVEVTMQLHGRALMYGNKQQHDAWLACRNELLSRLAAKAPPAAGEGFVVPTVEWMNTVHDNWITEDSAIGFLAYLHAAMLARPQPAQGDGWLPIESAPRDGSCVLLADSDSVTPGFYHDGSECYGHRGKAGFFDESDRASLLTASNFMATHWRPLPPPPAPADAGEVDRG